MYTRILCSTRTLLSVTTLTALRYDPLPHLQIILSILFQIEDAARRRRALQVARQKLAVLRTLRNEEFHCWGGSEGGSAAAGSDVVQRRGVCGGSVDREGQLHPLQETSQEQDSLGEDCFPAT